MTRINLNKKEYFLIIFIVFIIVAIIAKLYQYCYSSQDNFIIMNYILRGINDGVMTGKASFDFPIIVYSQLKWLGFKTNIEWSIFWCIIGNLIIFLRLSHSLKNYSILNLIYICATMFILDFTVFNANKDMIQFIFSFICLMILTSHKLHKFMKVTLCSLVLLIESIFFRDYYILAFGMFIAIYFLFEIFFNKKKFNKKRNVLAFIFLIMLTFFTGVLLSSIVAPDMFQKLISRRDTLEMIEANTIIRNIFKGEGYIDFVGNYLLNMIRMCFPFEIIGKGALMLIFCIYQTALSIFFIFKLKNVNRENVLIYTYIIAFMLTMFSAESDFGTFTRHESIMFFFFLELECKNKNVYRKKVTKWNKNVYIG